MKGGPENPNSKAVVDFIELNPENLVRNYHKRMSASIEMAREFGDSNASGEILRLRDRIELEARKAKTKGEAAAIRAEGKKSIQAIFFLIRQIHISPYIFTSFFVIVHERFYMLSIFWKIDRF